MSSGWRRVVDCQYLFRLVWPKHFSLGARPRIHMHRHILVYVRSALMSIISSFWIMLNYCSVGGALFFEFSNFRSKFRFFSNFQIQLVLQLDLDLDSARYTCRITNRRLALARSSLTTAPTQLVIIMTAKTFLDLVQPVCAPTSTDCSSAPPHSIPLTHHITAVAA